MLSFYNPGEIDVRLISLFGANVKETDSAIGFFGTGMKYAIATTLRLGGSIEIWSGLEKVEVTLEAQEIRGKIFEIVHINGTPTGFTSEVGKQWEAWQAYREFYCNALDENGGVLPVKVSPQAGKTVICVEGLDEIWEKREDYFIEASDRRLYANATLQLLPKRASEGVFYKGILVGELTAPLFTYNFLRTLNLTEDRTVRTMWDVCSYMRKFWLSECLDENLLEKFLTAPKNSFEERIAYDSDNSCSQLFADTLDRLYTQKAHLTAFALAYIRRTNPKHAKYGSAKLTAVQKKMLDKALTFLRSIGIEVNAEIIYTQELPMQDQLGEARNGNIYVSSKAFDMGTKALAGTIFEEHLHLTEGFVDESRRFQNYLIDKVMSFGEEILGEPL